MMWKVIKFVLGTWASLLLLAVIIAVALWFAPDSFWYVEPSAG
jgi:hypothetical protein